MRKTIELMDDWLFTGPSGKKERIRLPHTWNGQDGQDGGNDYYRGTCIYEKNFPFPKPEKGRRVYLQFHGVNASAKVVLNGKEVCTHDNGYSTFRIDVTEGLREENQLLVKVDNGVNDRVYPQVADFTFYGGIYREVELLVVNELHFDLDYYGGRGIWFTSRLEEGRGRLGLQAYLGKEARKEEGLTVSWQLFDREGARVATAEGKETEILLHNPHLWNGVEDPYLYELVAILKRGEDPLDMVKSHLGFRSFRVDPDKGFFLNGKSYPLRGVSRHQDRRETGNAISRKQMDEDMELIREIGANSIRLAHYQHDQYFYDLCDRYGMVVWAEIPYISVHMPEGRKNTLFQMKELIVQNHHHPSIVTWGISNEITIKDKHRQDMLDNHRQLQELCRQMDPSRPTTLACYAMCSPFHPVTKITDLVAWNLYLGWYVPGFRLNDWFMKFYHWKYPARCLGYSEYGAEGMPNLHSKRPKRGDHSEEYQAKYHEYMLNCFERHPFLWGTYVWNMFDFAADARDQGGEAGMNHKGLVTFDRKIKKDSFYLYKAWWSKEPFLHICGKRYQYRSGKTTEIKVYSNQREISLYQNGRLVERKTGDKVFSFRITLEEENRLEARAGKLNDEVLIHHCPKERPEYKVAKGKSQNWV